MTLADRKAILYLDAGQNVSHDDLLTAVLWKVLTEF